MSVPALGERRALLLSPCRPLCCSPGSLGAPAVCSDRPGIVARGTRHPLLSTFLLAAFRDGLREVRGLRTLEMGPGFGVGVASSGLPAFPFRVKQREVVCKGSLWSRPWPHSGLEALRLHYSRDLHPLPRNGT